MAVMLAPIMSAMTAAAPVLAMGGTILSTAGVIKQGNAAKATANYNAAQLDAAAKTEQASAQRAANEETRQKELVLSRARSVAAASGGGQDTALLGDIEEDGTLRSLTAMWEGEEAAKGRKAQAAVSRFEGKQAKLASLWKAGSTLLSGGASFAEQYG